MTCRDKHSWAGINDRRGVHPKFETSSKFKRPQMYTGHMLSCNGSYASVPYPHNRGCTRTLSRFYKTRGWGIIVVECVCVCVCMYALFRVDNEEEEYRPWPDNL